MGLCPSDADMRVSRLAQKLHFEIPTSVADGVSGTGHCIASVSSDCQAVGVEFQLKMEVVGWS